MTSPGGEQMSLPNMPSAGPKTGKGAAASVKAVQQGLNDLLGVLGKVEASLKRIDTLAASAAQHAGQMAGGARAPMSNGGVGTGATSMGMPRATFGGVQTIAPAGMGHPVNIGTRPPSGFTGGMGAQIPLQATRSSQVMSLGARFGGALASGAAAVLPAVGAAAAAATFGQMSALAQNAVSNDYLVRDLAMTGTNGFTNGKSMWSGGVGFSRHASGAYMNSQERNAAAGMALQGGMTVNQINAMNSSSTGIRQAQMLNPGASGQQIMANQLGLDSAQMVNTLRAFGMNSRGPGGAANPVDQNAIYAQLFDRQAAAGGGGPRNAAEAAAAYRPGRAAYAQMRMMNFSEEQIQAARQLNVARFAGGATSARSIYDPAVRNAVNATGADEAATREGTAGITEMRASDSVVEGIRETNVQLAKLNRLMEGLPDTLAGKIALELSGNISALGNAQPGRVQGGPLGGFGSAIVSGLTTAASMRGLNRLPGGSILRGAGRVARFLPGLAGRGAAAAGAGALGVGAASAAAVAGGAYLGYEGVRGMLGADYDEGFGGWASSAWQAGMGRHFNDGGEVDGHGMGDSVKARLTPGEVVVPRHAVAHHGGASELMRKLGFGGRKDGGTEYASGGAVSGMLGDAELFSIGGGHRLRRDAASAWNRMVQETGRKVGITDSYRSYAAQVDVKRRKPTLAAKPGTSNHGWGTALDLNVGGFGSETYRWLSANAPKYGWVHPNWAQQGGSKPEPWHWEYKGGSQPVVNPGNSEGTGGVAAGESAVAGAQYDAIRFASEMLGIGTGAAAAAARPGVTASTSTKTTASTSTGGAAKSTGGSVGGWVRQALGILGLDPARYSEGIMHMIQKESGGNPKAVNNWDSNAAKGTPSKGLMQTIEPTFKAYALKGYDQDIFDPVSNIIAGVRYAQKRYGLDMLAAGGRKDKSGQYKGYSEGNWKTTDEVARLHEGEMVLPSRIADAVRTAMREGSGNRSSGGGGRGGGNVSITVQVMQASEAEARRLATMVKGFLEEDSYERALGAA